MILGQAINGVYKNHYRWSMWQPRCCLYFQLLVYGDNKLLDLQAVRVQPAGVEYEIKK